jgi:hypothetical protein
VAKHDDGDEAMVTEVENTEMSDDNESSMMCEEKRKSSNAYLRQPEGG